MIGEGFVYAAFAAAIALPALPAALELRARRDALPLALDSEYAGDPRYLGKSFRQKIAALLRDCEPGSEVQFLQRANERARIVDDYEAPAGSTQTCAILARGAANVGEGARLLDLFSAEAIKVGRGAMLRTVVANENIAIGERVTIARFADTERDITVGPHATVEYGAFAGGACRLAQHVAFHRLFGNPVTVGKIQPKVEAARPAGETIDTDTISAHSIEIAANTLHTGSIKSDGDVVIRAHARIGGNVIARGSVHVGTGASVGGHIYSERDVVLGYDAGAGAPERSKTVYASGNVTLFPGAYVYGSIVCEGRGETR